jgi:hypothetical protein
MHRACTVSSLAPTAFFALLFGAFVTPEKTEKGKPNLPHALVLNVYANLIQRSAAALIASSVFLF